SGGAPVAPATVSAPATSPPAPPTSQPSLHAQVARPVVHLAQAADGDHVLTLSVTPEHLGPVTVRAHVAGGDLRIELFAPHDAGRDALRALAGDLRRDLAGLASTATLSVASSSAPAAQPDGGGAHDPAGGRRDGQPGTQSGPQPDRGRRDAPSDRTPHPTATAPVQTAGTAGATRRLDVLV